MSGRAKKRVGLVVAVAVLLLVLTAAPASSTDTLNRPLLTRTGTFSITLKKHGRTIGAFVCRMSATQFQRGFRVKASPESGWLSLPAGRWDLAMAIRVDSYRPKATPAFSRVARRWRKPGKVSFVWRGNSEALGIDSGKVGPRIACGLLAYAHGQRRSHPYRRLFATVAWPSFKLLGVNVPVGPAQPGGGID